MSAGAVKPAVVDLAEVFRRETGHVVQFTFATVGTLQQKIAAGETADVFLMTDAAIDDLAQKGIAATGTRTDLARGGIGVAAIMVSGTFFTLKSIRLKLGTSQSEFALMIGVSPATLQNWEQGRRMPEGPARALLKVATDNPKAVAHALGA